MSGKRVGAKHRKHRPYFTDCCMCGNNNFCRKCFKCIDWVCLVCQPFVNVFSGPLALCDDCQADFVATNHHINKPKHLKTMEKGNRKQLLLIPRKTTTKRRLRRSFCTNGLCSGWAWLWEITWVLTSVAFCSERFSSEFLLWFLDPGIHHSSTQKVVCCVVCIWGFQSPQQTKYC